MSLSVSLPARSIIFSFFLSRKMGFLASPIPKRVSVSCAFMGMPLRMVLSRTVTSALTGVSVSNSEWG